jgi:hypothetical protein
MKAKALLLCGIAAVLLASLFALPALASSGRDGNRDGIPDRWEAKFHLPLSKDQAPRDQDKDGVKNLAEYRDGTNPRQPNSDASSTDGPGSHQCELGQSGGAGDDSGSGTTTPSS